MAATIKKSMKIVMGANTATKLLLRDSRSVKINKTSLENDTTSCQPVFSIL